MLKALIKASVKRLGLDLSLSHNERSEENRVFHTLSKFDIRNLIDVGANIGQFSSAVIAAGFRGKIISFEPLPDAHEELSRLASRFPQWRVAPRCALGDAAGNLILNRSEKSACSSFLPMLQKHLDILPDSKTIGAEPVAIRRLDQCPEVNELQGDLFLKIDTQGYELHVLQGASEIMPRIKGLLLEASIVPLYEGCPLIAEVIDKMRDYGFAVVDLIPALRAPDGQMLQVNIIAIR